MTVLSSTPVAQKAPPPVPGGEWAHGPRGLFSQPALERPLYSAVITPFIGLQSVLPVRGTNVTDPLYGIITGVTPTTGNEPVGVCDDPPTAGVVKLCSQYYVFGRESRQTTVLDISRGQRLTSRGEHTDFIVFGTPMGMEGNPLVPSLGAQFGGIANDEMTKRMVEWMVAWSRDFARVLYIGNPSNNTAGGGYKEPYGLDFILNTGHRDAETGQLCPAADPIIRSFGNRNITTTPGAGADLVRLISYIMRNLHWNAANMNLAPVEWVMSMPFGLFYELTEIWPIAYSTYRANNIPAGSTQFVDSMVIERMRDEMRGDLGRRVGQYLLVDGQRIPVILDDAIVETSLSDAAFSSSLYIIPLRVLGGRETTFIEYLNYNTLGVLPLAAEFAPGGSFTVTDNGRFLIHRKPPTNFCTQIVGLTEWRVVCLTPHLGARVTNIAFTPLIHERSGFPDSNYFVDGGVTQGYAPSYFGQPV